MSENLVDKIALAETKAAKMIDEAKVKARLMIENSKKKLEEDVEKFHKDCATALKDFKNKEKEEYKIEAEKISKGGEKAEAEYLDGIKDRLPDIQKQISQLIKEELCL